MARRPVHTSLRQLSEINLTPLMDLTFILLITFIITFPLIEQGISVELPRGEGAPLEADASRTISIDLDGNLYLDDTPIAWAALGEALAPLGGPGGPAVLVRADEDLPYRTVVRALTILQQAKVTRMALVTQSQEESNP